MQLSIYTLVFLIISWDFDDKHSCKAFWPFVGWPYFEKSGFDSAGQWHSAYISINSHCYITFNELFKIDTIKEIYDKSEFFVYVIGPLVLFFAYKLYTKKD